MSATNTVVLIGRLGQDPEPRQAAGKAVADISLAVSRTQKDANGSYITDWINCTLWGKQAERLHQYVKKGHLISVTGSLQIQTWETPEGQKRSKAVIQADNFQMLESKRDSKPY